MCAVRYTDAGDTRSAVTRVPPSLVQERLSATPTRQGARIDGISRGLLLSGTRRHGVFFLPDDSLCLVSAQGPPQRGKYLLSPEVGRGADPSGQAGSDAADA